MHCRQSKEEMSAEHLPYKELWTFATQPDEPKLSGVSRALHKGNTL